MKIEEFGDLSEYVENQDEVLKVLSKFSFDIKYNGLVDRNDIDMYNYTFTIKNEETGVKHSFDYNKGIGNDIIDDNNRLEGVINALWCIISDFMCYYMDFDEFVDTFGYEQEECEFVLKIWKKIKYNNEMLLDLMSEDDIEILRDNIQL